MISKKTAERLAAMGFKELQSPKKRKPRIHSIAASAKVGSRGNKALERKLVAMDFRLIG